MSRRAAAWAGGAVLVGLSVGGVWSLYVRAVDPRRLARAAVEDGSATRALSATLAGHRLCASVLDAVEPFPVYGTSAELPSVRALLAAGLIEPVPEAERPLETRYPHLRLSPAAVPFVLAEPAGGGHFVSLCYGRPEVVGVHLESDGSLDPAPVLRFSYTVVDRPAWVDRPDIRAAFPFLDEMTAGPVRARVVVRFRGRAPALEHLEIVPDLDVPAAVGGFGYCPPQGLPRPAGCDGGR